VVSDSTERFLRNKLETIEQRQAIGKQSREDLERRVDTLEEDCRDLAAIILAILDDGEDSFSAVDLVGGAGDGDSTPEALGDRSEEEPFETVVDRLRGIEAGNTTSEDSESSLNTFL